MAHDDTTPGVRISGALIGWERRSSRHGVIITLQLVENAAQYHDHQFHKVSIALNERQLRSLARDLGRAARARGLDLQARPPLHKRLWQGLKTALMR